MVDRLSSLVRHTIEVLPCRCSRLLFCPLSLEIISTVNMISTGQNLSPDAWSSFASRYEKGTGGTTRHIARHLANLCPPFTPNSVVLDNACGTGIMTEEVQRILTNQHDAKVKVYAADAAKAMTQMFKVKQAKAKESGSWPNIAEVSIHHIPAEGLHESVVPTESITHSYMNFGLFFCTDPVKAAGHIYRSLAPGGTAFVTSWADLVGCIWFSSRLAH